MEQAQFARDDAPSEDVRGRTSRRRSSLAETYVCVLAWIIRAPTFDTSAQEAEASNGHRQASSSGLVAPHADADELLAHVQEVRRRFDAAYSRWEPHVTLIPPFVVPFRQRSVSQRKSSGSLEKDDERRTLPEEQMVDDGNAEHTGSPSSSADNDGEDRLAELQDHSRDLQDVDPFEDLNDISRRIETICAQHDASGSSTQRAGQATSITFDRLDQFPLRRYKTVHLRPSTGAEGTKSFVALQGKLAKALPEASLNSRNAATRKTASRKSAGNDDAQPYTAHLTLGQASNPQKEAELCEALQVLGFPATSQQQGGTVLPNGSTPITSPLTVPLEAIQLLYKPIKRSGPYDVYREFRLV